MHDLGKQISFGAVKHVHLRAMHGLYQAPYGHMGLLPPMRRPLPVFVADSLWRAAEVDQELPLWINFLITRTNLRLNMQIISHAPKSTLFQQLSPL